MASKINPPTPEDSLLKVGYGGPWNTVHPGLQHTLVGDLVLSNQFEALVGNNEQGVSVPLGAASWTVSDDFKIFEFKIDSTKKFSDGSPLKASSFKKSWEDSLRLVPVSANNSLLDVLYKIEGFEEFKNSGEIRGIVADDSSNKLRINFTSPFRMALEHLQGNRFAAFKETPSGFIGTGDFVIKVLKEDKLNFVPNDNILPEFEVSVVKETDAISALNSGSLDLFAWGRADAFEIDISKHKNLSVLIGQDAVHKALELNTQNGRLFSRRELRLAFQFLVLDVLKVNKKILGEEPYSIVDPQVFLRYQAGRIEEIRVQEIIETGRKFVPDLIKASQAQPLVIYEAGNSSFRDLLEQAGLKISNGSKVTSKKELIDAIYKGTDLDIAVAGFSVASGDPDGIYHVLGKNGAIVSPMHRNERIESLLEVGRQLIQAEEIDLHYKAVSEAVLEEVPFVHLGFSKAIAIYRNDRVAVESGLLRRNQGRLNIFRKIQ